ncbi:hypothetical protein QT711_11510 [Sporosarcina saromensis]|uniref:Uncharacterized protein n=1 Tax=Sporosarcina saromensis TaxID=359365 RepID=A0ABU4GBY3_9BACL|nr:hypothetical protein [Sporosarcina saromensis]MDW0113815.1 hypothetical protein [Sporosarcina saromensis]
MFVHFIAAMLLRKKKHYMRAVKIGERNVLITIEEYIPATETLKNLKG